ncbi:MAG: 4'-phosphopantetheinyl transferase superfamily protein [Undibacterium sp.]|nr:4'-phosphopantetheinyl transferase superfamily protein [Undibacterium sp.]
MTLELNPQQIDIWCVLYDQIHDPALLAQYALLMSPDEHRRHQRFYFEKDRHRFLLTRALTRTVLSRYAAVSPNDWVFDKNAYGMPLIVNEDAIARKIVFNISHTANMICLAVSTGRAIGIDTENTVQRKAAIDAGHHFFSTRESADLGQLAPEMQHEAFFHYWTLKESYIKARGMGLSIPLSQFSFNLTKSGHIDFQRAPILEDTIAHWDFKLQRVSSDYLLALCWENNSALKPSLCFRQLVPLGDEKPIEVQLVSLSA